MKNSYLFEWFVWRRFCLESASLRRCRDYHLLFSFVRVWLCVCRCVLLYDSRLGFALTVESKLLRFLLIFVWLFVCFCVVVNCRFTIEDLSFLCVVQVLFIVTWLWARFWTEFPGLGRRKQICSSIWDADEPEVDEAETACMRRLILDLDEK